MITHHDWGILAVVERVVVLGRGGAGKSTAAAELGRITGLPVVELDAHFWDSKLVPLTKDFASLKSQMGVMTPYAYTHVALGVEFGYHVLSPNAPYAEGVSYTNKKTQKYMIVLTDGEQTEPAFGPGGTRSVAQGDSNLEMLCSNAKASGITMLTVAFDLDDSSQRARLKGCASDEKEDFFVANSSDEMAQAFQTITAAISSQVFLSK